MRSHEEDCLLLAAQRGDRRARAELVGRHLGLVSSIARRYRDLGLPVEDLEQEGSVGLLEAIERFDEARGADFESFARFRIRRAIRNALTEKSRLIRLPKRVVERRRMIERAQARLAAARGRAPTPREIALALGIGEAVVRESGALAGTPVSLDARVLEDGSTLEEIVADAAAVDPETEVVDEDEARLVDEAVATLPERQREIVSRHFGLGCDAQEIADLATSLHLSQQRTRTIERDALYALRDRLGPRPQSESPSFRRRRN